MVEGLIGRKLGMTQIFEEDGRVVPVTAIEVGPCLVVQKKTEQRDGYEAVQLGLIEQSAPSGKDAGWDRKLEKRLGKPRAGHLKKSDSEKNAPPYIRVLREFRVRGEDAPEAGTELTVELFAGLEKLDVVGTSKGRGFAGVMKRHGFSGGRATHGSMFHRAPGSIGQAAWPSRVFKGTRLPGQMGNRKITVRNLQVVRVEPENNLLLVRGAVPGALGSVVQVKKPFFGTLES